MQDKESIQKYQKCGVAVLRCAVPAVSGTAVSGTAVCGTAVSGTAVCGACGVAVSFHNSPKNTFNRRATVRREIDVHFGEVGKAVTLWAHHH